GSQVEKDQAAAAASCSLAEQRLASLPPTLRNSPNCKRLAFLATLIRVRLMEDGALPTGLARLLPDSNPPALDDLLADPLGTAVTVADALRETAGYLWLHDQNALAFRLATLEVSIRRGVVSKSDQPAMTTRVGEALLHGAGLAPSVEEHMAM